MIFLLLWSFWYPPEPPWILVVLLSAPLSRFRGVGLSLESTVEGKNNGSSVRKAGRRVMEDVYDHTQSKVPIPVPLMAVKRLMVWLVLGRVTTREYQML